MRFPSLALVSSETIRVTRRFPLVVLAAVTAAVAGILLLDSQEDENLLRLLLAGALGLPLFVALSLLVEGRQWPLPLRAGLLGLGAAALIGFYLVWPSWSDPVALRRYIQLSLGAHLLAAVIPYAGSGPMSGFWQYNKTLFLRFLVSALYAAILFAGLSIALVAIDKLFGAHIDEDTYVRLWILVAFLFTTLYFLGGIPRNLETLSDTDDYPRGLRVFSQFILLPIVTLYLAILTVYMGKIAITRVWPSGWIGYLVSSVAVLGILSLLLVFPVQEREENRWVRTYSRGFYIMLLPSVGMLLLAIWKRVDQYGITENRYFMVVLSVWLAALSIYGIVNRSRNIKVIPVTLCALAFLTAFGPWGAYAVSTSSQRGRLEAILTEHGVLAAGRIRTGVDHDLPLEARREVSATVEYLVQTHGPDPLRAWFEDRLVWADSMGTGGTGGRTREPVSTARRITEAMGIAYIAPRNAVDIQSFNTWTTAMTEGVPVSGYDHVFVVDGIPGPAIQVGGREVKLEYEVETLSLRLDAGAGPLIRIPLAGAIERARARSPKVAADPISNPPIRVDNDRVALQLVIRNLSGYEGAEGPLLTGFNALVFLRFKE